MHKFLSQKIFDRSRPIKQIFGFSDFFPKTISPKFLRYRLFPGGMFLNQILDTQNMSKNHLKNFGEQHNIKDLYPKKFEYIQKAQKIQNFRFFVFFS